MYSQSTRGEMLAFFGCASLALSDANAQDDDRSNPSTVDIIVVVKEVQSTNSS